MTEQHSQDIGLGMGFLIGAVLLATVASKSPCPSG